ncbi:histidine kinase [Herbaspirillum sp. VT-16-41]|uniref:histidine kinase n=1 Tax=Herbaspirillum sp. VT-16-41 TaxID=1953765 RepID=UPI000981D3A4|nr:histidine kinase [Herbaspirillum sp. VT-16-41]ONN65878.1 histidine kinase [Herbaspirillum sp. VT-16-41]
MSLTHHLPRILVIDADLDAIEMARFTLWRNQLPCQFEWFDDAELANASLLTQALCRARDLPTLILLDPRSFPGTEGYELLRTLCVYQTLAHIPLVLFTAAPLSSDFAREQDGRIWYAAKPQRATDYMELVTQCVQQRLHQPEPF